MTKKLYSIKLSREGETFNYKNKYLQIYILFDKYLFAVQRVDYYGEALNGDLCKWMTIDIILMVKKIK